MPLVEKVASAAELQVLIERLDWMIERNPAMTKDLNSRREAAQRELNGLLLSQPGYEVVKTADVQAAIDAARKEGYTAGRFDQDKAN